jgi:hypothetical protein
MRGGNQRRRPVGGLAHLSYFRRRRVRLSARFRLRPKLSLPSRFAFTATCRRYRWTISSPEAPAIRLAVASKAARIFSLTINSASRRALLPPRISFIIRSATTPFASTANIIKELTILRRPLHTCLPRRKSGNGSRLQLDQQRAEQRLESSAIASPEQRQPLLRDLAATEIICCSAAGTKVPPHYCLLNNGGTS